MAHGLVQQNAGPSRAEDDFHISGGSLARVKLQDRLARGLFGKKLRSLVAKKEVERNPSAAARTAASRSRLRLRDAGNIHPRQWLRVFRKRAVRADHQDRPQFVGIAGAYFLDPRIVAASGAIGAHQQLNLGGNVRVHRRQRHGVQAAGRLLLESGDCRFGRRARNQSRGAGRVQNALRRKIVRVGIPGALARDDAYAAARRNPLRGGLHQRFIHHQRGRGQVFEIKVGVVATSRKRRGQISLQIVVRKSVVGEEEAFLGGNHHIWMPLALQTTRAATALSHGRNTRASSCEPRASSNRRSKPINTRALVSSPTVRGISPRCHPERSEGPMYLNSPCSSCAGAPS